jgi:TldD protein
MSNGAMRASGWNRIPLIRMTNVSLEPGDWSLDDLIADTDEGLYMETNRSWSIDDKRLNFQFGTELAREIKNGKLGDLVRNATYTGITPQFWGSCDAIVNRDGWVVWGTPNCGKGQPEQVAHTGHGASAARFRNVRVGVMQ